MDFVPQAVMDYAARASAPESALLQALTRDTYLKVMYPRMLSGHIQGRLLSFIAKVVAPRRVLEIGTYTGYSALCMAEGLTSDGRLHTIEIDAETAAFAGNYFTQAGLTEKIVQHIGDAVALIPTIDETFDLVFIDGEKEQYPDYYELSLSKTRSGGVLIIDNLLWSGSVINLEIQDKTTQALRDFATFVAQDARVEPLLLPVRDGIYLVRKL